MDPLERERLEAARVARLATAGPAGRPHVVPICFALMDQSRDPRIVTPLDEKPKSREPTALRRVRDIRANPHVALVVDEYREDWSALYWVQVRGTASLERPNTDLHTVAVSTLRQKYTQYEAHDLDSRPIIVVEIGHVRSWGVSGASDG